MAEVIVSDHSQKISPLSSHKGLTPIEILQDCLNKAHSLLTVLVNEEPNLSIPSMRQYISTLDDLVILALDCRE